MREHKYYYTRKTNTTNYVRYKYLHTWRDSQLCSQNRKVTVVLEGFLLLINNIAWPPCTSDGHTTMRERSNMGSIATKLPLITRPKENTGTRNNDNSESMTNPWILAGLSFSISDSQQKIIQQNWMPQHERPPKPPNKKTIAELFFSISVKAVLLVNSCAKYQGGWMELPKRTRSQVVIFIANLAEMKISQLGTKTPQYRCILDIPFEL